jgi:hypothetical protein
MENNSFRKMENDANHFYNVVMLVPITYKMNLNICFPKFHIVYHFSLFLIFLYVI